MKFVTFLIVMGITLIFLQANQVLGQQVVNEAVKEEVQQTAQEEVRTSTLPIDATLITAIASSVGGLLWKDRKDKKEIEAQLKEAIEALMVLNASYIKFFNACMLYPDKKPNQILMLKSANNALEDSTLAAEMANGISKYQKFASGNFHLQAPNMSTPSAQVINATTVIPENRVTEIHTVEQQSPPPSSTEQQNTSG